MNIFQEYYNQDGIDYGINSSRKRKILELIGQESGRKILDLGCCSGYLGEEIKKNNNYVVGIDISSQAVSRASAVLDQALVLDIQQDILPFADKYFDVVVLSEVIEHLFFPEKTLAEARRVLKDDGFIVITTPNFLFAGNRIKMLLGKFNYTNSGFYDRAHIHFYTRKSLIEFLNKAGFDVAAENHVPYYRFPEVLANWWPGFCAFQLIVKAKNNQIH